MKVLHFRFHRFSDDVRRWPRRCRIATLAVFLFTISLCFSEWQMGFFSNVYFNYYNKLIFLQTTINRTKALNISIVVVIDRTESLKEYALAYNTLSCYALLHKYSLILIDFSKNETLQGICSQSDFMFRRQCAVVNLLVHNPTIDYILFVDGDMGVINPNHTIEEYILPRSDAELIFYERIFNYEIMVGSYIAKRTEFSIDFLSKWVNYFYHLPNSFHGTDNGAIHSVFLDELCGNCSKSMRRICNNLWNQSKNFKDLQLFSSCARSVLGDRNVFANGKVHLLTNHSSWARDGWLTNNEWSQSDFILHGWQTKRENLRGFAGWNSPLARSRTTINTSRLVKRMPPFSCLEEDLKLNWPYKDTFMRSNEIIQRKIADILASTRAQHLENLRKIIA